MSWRRVTVPRRRIAVLMGGRSSEHRDLARLGPVGDRGPRPGALRGRAGRDRAGRAVGAAPPCHVTERPARRRGSGPPCRIAPSSAARSGRGRTRSRPRWAGSRWCCRSCTGRSGRTGGSRGCSEMAGRRRTSGPTTPPRPMCMDKDVFKAVLRDAGRSRSRATITLRADEPREGMPAHGPFGYPVFVKPARLGSTRRASRSAHDDAEALAGRRRARLRGTTRRCSSRSSSPGSRSRCGVLGNRRAVRLARRRDRGRRATSGTTTRRSTHDGEHGPGRARTDHRRADRERAGARGPRRSSPTECEGHGARRLLRPATTARCWSTS